MADYPNQCIQLLNASNWDNAEEDLIITVHKDEDTSSPSHEEDTVEENEKHLIAQEFCEFLQARFPFWVKPGPGLPSYLKRNTIRAYQRLDGTDVQVVIPKEYRPLFLYMKNNWSNLHKKRRASWVGNNVLEGILQLLCLALYNRHHPIGEKYSTEYKDSLYEAPCDSGNVASGYYFTSGELSTLQLQQEQLQQEQLQQEQLQKQKEEKEEEEEEEQQQEKKKELQQEEEEEQQQPQNSDHTVIYLHGNAESAKDTAENKKLLVEKFANKKANLVLLDQPGYGRSTGRLRSPRSMAEGVYYAALDNIVNKKQNKITLIGRSLGGLNAVIPAAIRLRKYIKNNPQFKDVYVQVEVERTAKSAWNLLWNFIPGIGSVITGSFFLDCKKKYLEWALTNTRYTINQRKKNQQSYCGNDHTYQHLQKIKVRWNAYWLKWNLKHSEKINAQQIRLEESAEISFGAKLVRALFLLILPIIFPVVLGVVIGKKGLGKSETQRSTGTCVRDGVLAGLVGLLITPIVVPLVVVTLLILPLIMKIAGLSFDAAKDAKKLPQGTVQQISVPTDEVMIDNAPMNGLYSQNQAYIAKQEYAMQLKFARMLTIPKEKNIPKEEVDDKGKEEEETDQNDNERVNPNNKAIPTSELDCLKNQMVYKTILIAMQASQQFQQLKEKNNKKDEKKGDSTITSEKKEIEYFTDKFCTHNNLWDNNFRKECGTHGTKLTDLHSINPKGLNMTALQKENYFVNGYANIFSSKNETRKLKKEWKQSIPWLISWNKEKKLQTAKEKKETYLNAKAIRHSQAIAEAKNVFDKGTIEKIEMHIESQLKKN